MIDVRQDPDHVPGRLVVLVVAVVLATIVVSVVAVALMTTGWRDQLSSNPGGAGWEERIPADVSHVEAASFGRATDAETEAAAARIHLGTFGWSDRERGRVHIPIDVAMRLYLEEQGK